MSILDEKQVVKITCTHIELAIMKEFDHRKNVIVPNVTSMMGIVPFETDMLVLTKAGMAYGFEIKVSKSDLVAEFKKRQHTDFDKWMYNKTGLEHYYGKFKYFYFAVPERLKDYAMEIVPERFGIYSYYTWKRSGHATQHMEKFYEARKPLFLFNRKWNDKERFEVARLGAMRIYTLKKRILNLCSGTC